MYMYMSVRVYVGYICGRVCVYICVCMCMWLYIGNTNLLYTPRTQEL